METVFHEIVSDTVHVDVHFVKPTQQFARLPHKHNTWLGWGHTVPNGDPAEAYASNTKLCGAIILLSPSVPDGFYKLHIDENKEIVFLSVVPLYEEEMNLKLRLGSDELLNRLAKVGVNDIIDPARRNAAKKRFGLF